MNYYKNALLLILALIAFSIKSSCQEISIPKFDDKYSKLVAEVESGNLNIDYGELRYSFLESKQYALLNAITIDSLRKEMYKLVDEKKYQDIIKIAKEILSMDYTNLYGQLYLYKAYEFSGDSVNYKKYQTIESGLFYSITNGKKGTSYKTAWHAAQIYEEYRVLQAFHLQFLSQGLNTYKGRSYDLMTVKEDGKTKTYYFDITEHMNQIDKLFQGK